MHKKNVKEPGESVRAAVNKESWFGPIIFGVIVSCIVFGILFAFSKRLDKQDAYRQSCSKICGEYVVHTCYENDGIRYAVCGNQGVRKVETENDSPN